MATPYLQKICKEIPDSYTIVGILSLITDNLFAAIGLCPFKGLNSS